MGIIPCSVLSHKLHSNEWSCVKALECFCTAPIHFMSHWIMGEIYLLLSKGHPIPISTPCFLIHHIILLHHIWGQSDNLSDDLTPLQELRGRGCMYGLCCSRGWADYTLQVALHISQQQTCFTTLTLWCICVWWFLRLCRWVYYTVYWF